MICIPVHWNLSAGDRARIVNASNAYGLEEEAPLTAFGQA
jgi:hypothetical protein